MSGVHLEKTILEPDGPPRALAFVAHGRVGGTMDDARTSALANHLRSHYQARVIKWNARGIGKSEGDNEWSSPQAWMGEYNCSDYADIFLEGIRKFTSDFPKARSCDLFVCGYSCGAMYATTIRLPEGYDNQCFKPIKYILVSYPIAASPFVNLVKTGWYLRALEGLVGGVWEGCSHERPADVLSLMGESDIPWFSPANWAYNAWIAVLKSKNKPERGKFNAVVVEGADHVWTGKLHRIGEEVDRWLKHT